MIEKRGQCLRPLQKHYYTDFACCLYKATFLGHHKVEIFDFSGENQNIKIWRDYTVLSSDSLVYLKLYYYQLKNHYTTAWCGRLREKHKLYW